MIALPHANYIIEHLKLTINKEILINKFLNACRSKLSGKINDRITYITVQEGFNDVVDAFQNLQGVKLLILHEIIGTGKKMKTNNLGSTLIIEGRVSM